MTGTSGRQRVPEECLEKYKIVKPPKERLESFSKISKVIFQKIKNNGETIWALTELREILLPKLMSGKIKTPV